MFKLKQAKVRLDLRYDIVENVIWDLEWGAGYGGRADYVSISMGDGKIYHTVINGTRIRKNGSPGAPVRQVVFRSNMPAWLPPIWEDAERQWGVFVAAQMP